MINEVKIKRQMRMRRHRRVRAKIKGTAQKPRLSVFRSNKRVFLQLVDDEKGKTLVSVSSAEKLEKGKSKKTKTELAKESGKKLAEMAVEEKIKNVVFDRGGNVYHGRVKAVAEGAREGGLQF